MSRTDIIRPPAPTLEGFARFDNQNGGEIDMNADDDHDYEHESENTATNAVSISFKDLQTKNKSEEVKQNEEVKKGGKGFENPLFNEPKISIEDLTKNYAAKTAANVCSETTSEGLQKISVENPLYDLMVDITTEAAKPSIMEAEDVTGIFIGSFIKFRYLRKNEKNITLLQG